MLAISFSSLPVLTHTHTHTPTHTHPPTHTHTHTLCHSLTYLILNVLPPPPHIFQINLRHYSPGIQNMFCYFMNVNMPESVHLLWLKSIAPTLQTNLWQITILEHWNMQMAWPLNLNKLSLQMVPNILLRKAVWPMSHIVMAVVWMYRSNHPFHIQCKFKLTLKHSFTRLNCFCHALCIVMYLILECVPN